MIEIKFDNQKTSINYSEAWLEKTLQNLCKGLTNSSQKKEKGFLNDQNFIEDVQFDSLKKTLKSFHPGIGNWYYSRKTRNAVITISFTANTKKDHENIYEINLLKANIFPRHFYERNGNWNFSKSVERQFEIFVLADISSKAHYSHGEVCQLSNF